MRKLKEESSAREYCEGKSSYLAPVLEVAYNIGFKERPNYNHICFLLKKVVLDIDQLPSENFDWKNIANHHKSYHSVLESNINTKDFENMEVADESSHELEQYLNHMSNIEKYRPDAK